MPCLRLVDLILQKVKESDSAVIMSRGIIMRRALGLNVVSKAFLLYKKKNERIRSESAFEEDITNRHCQTVKTNREQDVEPNSASPSFICTWLIYV